MSDAVGNDQANFQEAMQAFYQEGGAPPPPAQAAVAAVVTGTPAPEPEKPAEVAAEVAPDPVADPALTPPAAEPAKAEPVPPDLQKLIAREAEIQSREEKFRSSEAHVQAVYEQMQAFERAKAEFFRDPAAFIKTLDPEATLASVAERLYYEEIGDKAPTEYKIKKEVTGVERQLAELRSELEKERSTRAALQQEQEVRNYRASLAAQASSLDEKSHPLLSGLAKRNAERFADLMFEAARKTAIETNGAKVLTPAEAAQAVEAFLVKQRDELYGPPPTAAKEQPKPPSGQVTVFNKSAAVQPSLESPDNLSDQELRKRALEAAGLGHLPVW